MSPPLASTAPQRWRQRIAQIRPSQAVAGFGAVLAAAIIAFTSFTLWYLREEALDDAERQVGKLNLVLAEQTLRAVEAVDVLLQATVDKLRGLDSQAASDGRWESPEAFHEMLKAQFTGMPQIRAVFVADHAGHLLHDSRQLPPPRLDISDRKYFAVHRDGYSGSLYIGEPVMGRIDGLAGFQVSRRYDDPFGSFAGVVGATLEPGYFLDLYKSIELGPGSTITLIRRDGVVLARHPHVQEYVGRSLAGSTGFTRVLPYSEHGTFRQTGTPGQVNRISSLRALSRYPLVLYVSMAESVALAHWRRQTVIFGGSALAGLATLLALLALLSRTFVRQEQLTGQLAASEQRFRDVVESASDWMWEMGPDLKFTGSPTG